MKIKNKLIVTLASLALLITGTGCSFLPSNDSRGIVMRIIDGDTVDMRIAGNETRVRLLNIDTPESVDPNKAIECLGPEATEYLKTLLAPGDEVELEYDIERTDRYGRTLAGVYKDDSLVNADIAAAGFGIAVKYEPNVRFYDEVLAAEQSASTNARGLFSPQIECTLPAQFEEAYQALDNVSHELSDDIDEAGSLAGQAAAALVIGYGAKSAMEALTPDGHPVTHTLLTNRFTGSAARLTTAMETVESTERSHLDQQEKLIQAEEARLEAERKAKAEAERLEREAEARKQEEQRQAAIAEQNRAKKQKQKKSTPIAPRKSKQKSTPKKTKSNYTGPRCYAPGGKTWRPC